MKRGFYLAIGVGVLGMVTAAIVIAQVYPIKWGKEAPSLPAVGAGVVALGEGGLALNPSQVIDINPFGASTGGFKVVDPTCSASNRGEIRLLNLSDENLPDPPKVWSSYDALCFCQQSIVNEGTPTYWWSCLKIQ